MSTGDPKPKPKRARNSTKEYARRKAKRLSEEKQDDEQVEKETEASQKEKIKLELCLLERQTKHVLTDADRDIDFAYRNMASPNIMPLNAPSMSAWAWYEYSRSWPDKFLEICAKREDAKSKAAGTITNQRMEDDKRKQFAIIDRIERQLTLDVRGTVKDLMDKFPEDVLLECRKNKDAWTAFFEKYPL